jgi:hypothetical protein
MRRLNLGNFNWILMLVVAWAFVAGPSIEGRLFPVVTDIKITRFQQVNGGTEFWGQFTKLRGNCRWDHMEWVLGDGERSVRAKLTILEQTKVRGAGRFEFGPWVVDITPEQFEHASYAVVYHHCHFGPLTPTAFYP